MTTTRIATVLALALVSTAAACDKHDKAGGAASGAKAAEGKPAATATGSIDAFGLAFDGPADAQVSDMTLGSSRAFMVMAEGLVFTVAEPSEVTAADLKEAVEASSMYEGATITVQETTPDGYRLEFNNTGSMGANYFVEIRRTIADKPYVCSTTAPNKAMAAAAVTACQSLRAKP